LSQCQSSQWSRGFIVFIDLNKSRTVDAGEKILQTEHLDLQYGTLDWKGTLSIPSLTFQAATGLPNGSNGGFYYCSLTDQPHQKLNLSRMGHLRLEKISAC
jgi:type IV fimbrial biogenesis protein FimT